MVLVLLPLDIISSRSNEIMSGPLIDSVAEDSPFFR